MVRSLRRVRDAYMLCLGRPQPLVRSWLRRSVRARLGVWSSARRVAIRRGRSNLVAGSYAQMAQVVMATDGLFQIEAVQ